MKVYLSKFLLRHTVPRAKVNIVKRIFEVEFEKSNITGEEKEWVNHFPEKKVCDLESAANYLMKELNHQDMADYNPRKQRFPPCSIMRSAMGKPSNCVGRVSSLVLLSEIKDFKTDMNERLMIEIEVDYKRNLDGTKSINGGHITAYTDLWGDKKYLGSRHENMISDPYPVNMLPAVYALQTSLAKIQEEKYRDAKKLAKLSRKWNIGDSSYISNVATRIVER